MPSVYRSTSCWCYRWVVVFDVQKKGVVLALRAGREKGKKKSGAWTDAMRGVRTKTLATSSERNISKDSTADSQAI